VGEKGIRLSQKHGVNPSMGVCFWCGEEDGNIALMGKLPNDAEEPRRAVVTYEPCEYCKAMMSRGFTLMEATESDPGDRPEVQPGVWPTGRWWVVTREAAERIFGEKAKGTDKAFIDTEAVKRLNLEEAAGG